MGGSVIDAAGVALGAQEVAVKLAATRRLRADWEGGALELAPPSLPIVPVDRPGVPEQPVLVPPRDVLDGRWGPRRGGRRWCTPWPTSS